MNFLRPEIINEIAQELDSGFLAYIHKTTGERIFVPDRDEYSEIEFEAWNEEFELLESNFSDYYEIEKWSSHEAYEIMLHFAEQLSQNRTLQNNLLDALNKRKPFSAFKFVIDNSGEFREIWFDFKNKKLYEYVEEQLNRLKEID